MLSDWLVGGPGGGADSCLGLAHPVRAPTHPTPALNPAPLRPPPLFPLQSEVNERTLTRLSEAWCKARGR